MTSPTLERAATRVAACLMDAPVDPGFSLADVNGWTRDKAYEIAHDVLIAVREPDGPMLKAGFAAMNATPSREWVRMKAENKKPREIFDAKMRPRWSAMIDAILKDKP